MITTFHKMMCSVCQKIRWHEKIITPSCVVCQEYNFSELDPLPVQEIVPETEFVIERFN